MHPPIPKKITHQQNISKTPINTQIIKSANFRKNSIKNSPPTPPKIYKTY
jgi:hypothetical protein